jgi:aspartyl-tRNA(Asn)/glutamyl-tRNA(Gln) amidotransferase subunit C
MLDQDQVQKVALLARLQLTSAEATQFAGQLGEIIDYFQQLEELDVTDVLPTTRAIDVSNIVRPDQLEPYGKREQLLAIAPDPDGEFFRVPKIMGER